MHTSLLPEARQRACAALRLTLHPALKPRHRSALMAAFQDPSEALDAHASIWEAHDIPSKVHREVRQDTPPVLQKWLEDSLQWLGGAIKGAPRTLLDWGDADYPQRLLALPVPPMALFALGNTALMKSPCVGMVGSRSASHAGLGTARTFSAWLAGRGWCIVSGLAAGIDAAAHAGALDCGVPGSIGVLGCGIDQVYPSENLGLFQRFLAQDNLIISEYPPGTPPLAALFPKRNRIIAGLSDGLVIVEAALRSGSLITARQAAELGRHVMAVPGSIHSPHTKGCHHMIRQGAVLVENAEQIEQELLGNQPEDRMPASHARPQGKQSAPASPAHALPLNDMERRVVEAVGYDPTHFDQLCERCDLPTEELLSILTIAQVYGWVSAMPGQMWVKNPVKS